MTYIKNHESWTSEDPITCAAMNNIESQWTEIKTIADAHNHDTRYYEKSLADTTFFTPSYFTGFDADKLDGSHLASLVTTVMPVGVIMMWHGSDGAIPSGWYVCDGSAHGGYTTPNLVERFVFSAGGAYPPGTTAGVAAWNGTITPTGTATIGAHTLTTAELPVHDHGYTEYYSTLAGAFGINGTAVNATANKAVTTSNQASGGGSHGHPGSTATFNAVDPRPVYYAIYFIMKCV